MTNNEQVFVNDLINKHNNVVVKNQLLIIENTDYKLELLVAYKEIADLKAEVERLSGNMSAGLLTQHNEPLMICDEEFPADITGFAVSDQELTNLENN